MFKMFFVVFALVAATFIGLAALMQLAVQIGEGSSLVYGTGIAVLITLPLAMIANKRLLTLALK